MISNARLASVVLALFSAGVMAADPGSTVELLGSGWWALQAGRGSEPFHDRREVIGGRGRLELAYRREALEAALKLERPTDANLGAAGTASVVREVWGRYRGDLFEATVGRQLLSEGRSDWLRPQGQFAPRDYTGLSMINAEQRIGLPALRLDMYPSEEWTVTLAAVYQDRGNNFAFPRALSIPAWGPLRQKSALGWLGRLDWRHDGLELGFSLSRGKSLSPAISDAGELSSYAQDQVGFDGSLSVDGSIFRWDLALIHNDTHRFSGIPRAEGILVLGVDKGVWTDGMAFIQWIRRQALTTNSDESAPFASTNTSLSQLYRRRQEWVSANLVQQIGQKSELEIGWMYGFREDSIAFARYSYNYADGWKLSLKLHASHGDADTLAGHLVPARVFFVELRQYF